MSDLILNTSILEQTKSEINNVLIKAGVNAVLLIDSAGNVIASCGNKSQKMDTTALAALAAANFGATSQIAKLIGEEDFSLLFHKGKKENIHFARIGKELILITIFSDDISLGLVRLRISQLAETIKKLFEERENGS